MPRNIYLDEIIEFGGELMPRGRVIAEMQAEGTPPQILIDRWLQGQELAARLRAERSQAPEAP